MRGGRQIFRNSQRQHFFTECRKVLVGWQGDGRAGRHREGIGTRLRGARAPADGAPARVSHWPPTAQGAAGVCKTPGTGGREFVRSAGFSPFSLPRREIRADARATNKDEWAASRTPRLTIAAPASRE